MQRAERLSYFLKSVYGGLIYGVFRRDVLISALRLIDRRTDSMGSDVLLVLNCVDKGDVVVLEEPLFFKRRHGISSSPDYYQGVWQVISSLLNYSLLLFRCFDWSSLSLYEKVILLKACILHIFRRILNYRSSICRLVKRGLRKAIT